MNPTDLTIEVFDDSRNGREHWRGTSLCGAVEEAITWQYDNGDEYASQEAIAGILGALLARLPAEEALAIIQGETSKQMRLKGEE